MTYQKIIKHGNCLAVVIPAKICRELKWKRGDYIELQVFERVDNVIEVCLIKAKTWKHKQRKSR